MRRRPDSTKAVFGHRTGWHTGSSCSLSIPITTLRPRGGFAFRHDRFEEMSADASVFADESALDLPAEPEEIVPIDQERALIPILIGRLPSN